MKDSPAKPHSLSSLLQSVLLQGSRAVVVTLIAAPKNVGAKLIVQAEGTLHGTLGDAALDAAAVQPAELFLSSNDETRVFYGKEFAPALAAFGEAQFLFELIQPEQRLVICGAGHVGAALAKLASTLSYRVVLIDDRKEFLKQEDFAGQNVELVVAESWSKAVANSVGNGAGVSIAIVTRGHSEDEQCLRATLTAGKPDYVGLIGSRRRTRIVLDRLRQAGIAEEQLQRVHAPIGLDIGAVTPEEVALAILAEIVAARRGGTGGSLRKAAV